MTENHRMRTTAAAVALITALLLAACGSSSNKTSSNTAATAPTVSTTTTTSTSGTVTTPTHTTTTTTGIPLCTASLLSLSFIGQQGATGHGELGFALRNTSAHPCHTFGYPGVLFLDKSGKALPTKSTRTTNDLAGPAPARHLVVTPGSSVSFRLFVTHFTANGGSAGCTTAYGLQVIPPDDTATLRTTIPQGGASECGTTTVTPLQPGTSGYR